MPYTNERRREIYREMRALGLSSKEATQARSRGIETITENLADRDRTIRRIPRNERTQEQVRSQRLIQGYIERQIEQFDEDRFEDSQTLREINWSLWSRNGGEFPSEHLERIIEINMDNNLPQFDKFGFIAYYYEYVEDRTEDYAQDKAEQGSP